MIIKPKEKDINKTRPIVSYKGHGARKIGRMVSEGIQEKICRKI